MTDDMIKLLFANWIGASKEECHEVAHELERILSHRQKTYSIRIERHLCGRVHKKGAGIALTSLATLRHNHVIHKCAQRKGSRTADDA
jgi:hypothetical protein